MSGFLLAVSCINFVAALGSFCWIVLTRHRHKWTITGIDFMAPCQTFQLESVTGVEAVRVVRRLTEGVTHVYLRCDSCGELRQQDLFGRFNPDRPQDSELQALRNMAGLGQ